VIGKQEKGRSFRGCLKYVLEKSGAQLLGGNVLGESVDELAIEFNASRRLNPKLGVAVYHSMLSVPAHERRTDEQWTAITTDYLKEMGFGKCQYIMVRHTDQEHDHIHIVASRIQIPDGKTVSDSRDYDRSEATIRELERLYNLTPVQSSHELLDHAPTTGEVRKFESQQAQYEQGTRALPPEPPIRLVLQTLISHLTQDQPTMPKLIQRLKDCDVEVRVSQTHKQEMGISFQFAGEKHSGTGLGKAYTFSGLQKYKGVSYEPERDDAAIGAILGGGDRPESSSAAAIAADERTESGDSEVEASQQRLAAAAERLNCGTRDLAASLAESESATSTIGTAERSEPSESERDFERSDSTNRADGESDQETRSQSDPASSAIQQSESDLSRLTAELERLHTAVEQFGQRRRERRSRFSDVQGETRSQVAPIESVDRSLRVPDDIAAISNHDPLIDESRSRDATQDRNESSLQASERSPQASRGEADEARLARLEQQRQYRAFYEQCRVQVTARSPLEQDIDVAIMVLEATQNWEEVQLVLTQSPQVRELYQEQGETAALNYLDRVIEETDRRMQQARAHSENQMEL
jgi:hypothetical protein